MTLMLMRYLTLYTLLKSLSSYQAGVTCWLYSRAFSNEESTSPAHFILLITLPCPYTCDTTTLTVPCQTRIAKLHSYLPWYESKETPSTPVRIKTGLHTMVHLSPGV